MKKSDVNGENALPLYAYLKSQAGFEGLGKGPKALAVAAIVKKTDKNYKDNPDIKWNFTKFIVDKEGNVTYAEASFHGKYLVLLVPPPYDELYVRWMIAQYYWYMGEYEVYQNEKAMFDSAWNRWLLYLCRTERTGANEGRNPYDHA